MHEVLVNGKTTYNRYYTYKAFWIRWIGKYVLESKFIEHLKTNIAFISFFLYMFFIFTNLYVIEHHKFCLFCSHKFQITDRLLFFDQYYYRLHSERNLLPAIMCTWRIDTSCKLCRSVSMTATLWQLTRKNLQRVAQAAVHGVPPAGSLAPTPISYTGRQNSLTGRIWLPLGKSCWAKLRGESFRNTLSNSFYSHIFPRIYFNIWIFSSRIFCLSETTHRIIFSSSLV